MSPAQTVRGVMEMKPEEKIPDEFPDLRLSPERRLCALFDPAGVAMFPVADRGEMGFRVLDNCCEDHIM